MDMKFACELVVYEVLPAIRRGLAKGLVINHGLSQNEVAKMFGVTSAAVSQYMKGSRGGNDLIDNGSFKESLNREIEISAKRLAEGKSNIVEELCRLCDFAKTSGLLDELNLTRWGLDEYSKCQECPNK